MSPEPPVNGLSERLRFNFHLQSSRESPMKAAI